MGKRIPLKADEYGNPEIDSAEGTAPALDDWKPKKKRKRAHFLLSTMHTVAKSDNRAYGDGLYDFDFSYDARTCNRGNLVPKPSKDGEEPKAPEFIRFAHLFFDCVIPNAIIAKDAGYDVTVAEAKAALFQGMRMRASEEAIKKWEDYVLKHGGKAWVDSIVEEKFNLFVLGILRDGNKKSRYTIGTYVNKQMRKHASRYVNKLKHFTRKNTIALSRLIELFEDNPEISEWSYRRIHDEFGFSKNTIEKFKKYLEGTESALKNKDRSVLKNKDNVLKNKDNVLKNKDTCKLCSR